MWLPDPCAAKIGIGSPMPYKDLLLSQSFAFWKNMMYLRPQKGASARSS